MEIFKMVIFVLLGIELFMWITSMFGTKEKSIPIFLTLITITTMIYIVLK